MFFKHHPWSYETLVKITKRTSLHQNIAPLFLTVVPKDWISREYDRQTCRIALHVSDPRYIPDYHFSSSSWVPAGRPSNGRASEEVPSAWCPESYDVNGYLQVCWLSYVLVYPVGGGLGQGEYQSSFLAAES